MQEDTTALAEGAARLCQHFGVCGGCQHQDIAYARQAARKAESLEALFKTWWPHPIAVAPSPAMWHYRNKVDFSFGLEYFDEPPPPDAPRRTFLGYRQKGRWFGPLEVKECLIAPKGVENLLTGVRAWVAKEGLAAFNTRRRRGQDATGHLKILLVREAQRTGERMAALVTHPGIGDVSGFAETVAQHWPAHSVVHGISGAMNDAGLMDEVVTLDGAPHIHEELHIAGLAKPLRFRISPMSFFQTNTLATEMLYGAIREEVRATGAPFLYDLYGGSGGIAFACADLADEILSIESIAAATGDGRENAALNGIANVEFLTADVQRYLGARKIGGGLRPDAAVIADPPRSGLTPKALRRLNEMAPEHIVYVSCKPERFAEELEAFSESYRVESMRAFDLFPHTDHVELLARLRKR